MTAIAARAFVDIVFGPGLFGLAIRDKSDVGLIVNIISAVKNLWPFGDRFQHVPQGWHRTIVQVRRAQPDAIEKGRDVAARLVLDQTAPFDTKALALFLFDRSPPVLLQVFNRSRSVPTSSTGTRVPVRSLA